MPRRRRTKRPKITPKWILVERGTTVHRGLASYDTEEEANAERDRRQRNAPAEVRFEVVEGEEQGPK